MLSVPRSTYYWMTGHPEAERVDPIAGDVHAVRCDSHERYGARKIKATPGAEERHRVQKAHRRHHETAGHDERVRAQNVQTTQDAG